MNKSIQNYLNNNLVSRLKRILGSEFNAVYAFSGGLSLNNSNWDIEIISEAILSFYSAENDLIKLSLNIQGDDMLVQGEHIGLKFQISSNEFIDGIHFRFRLHFHEKYTIQKISFWRFSWKESTFPKMVNVAIFSLQNGKNLFIHLGSTSDARLLIKEQSVEAYFEERNEFYDHEFEVIEILKIE